MKDVKISNKIINRTSITSRYFRDMSNIKQLSPADEYKIAIKAAGGDIDSRNILVKSNLRFVISIAKMYNGGSDHKFEDLINEGNLGLVEAADTFDPSLGFKFISHAIWYIRKNIFRYLTDNSRQVRLPNSMINSLNSLRKIESELTQTLGRDVSSDEIITEFISRSQINKGQTPRRNNLDHAIYADRNASSLDMSMPGTDNLTILDILDLDDPHPDHLLILESNNKLLLRYLYKLKYLEREAIILKLGLNGNAPMGINEIAERYDVNIETIRSRIKMGILKIRSRIRQSNMSIDNFL